MLQIALIMLAGLTFESIGVVCMTFGMRRLAPPANYGIRELARLAWRALRNHQVMLGIFFQAIFFFILVYLLSQADLSFVWPLTALSFVFTTIAAVVFLKEEISRLRWAGVILIMCGAALITYTEVSKTRETAPDQHRSESETIKPAESTFVPPTQP